MICSYCKSFVDNDAIYCTNCGRKIEKQLIYNDLIEENTEITIGRLNSNDIILSNNSVSRNHAKIIFKNKSFYIEDLDSTNGVFVNGKKVSKSKITLSDKITIAKNIELKWDDILSAFHNKKSKIRVVPLKNEPLKNEIRIGRHPDNDIVIDNIKVSRHHARIKKEGNFWYIEDLGSSNGTFVDGKKIKKALVSDKNIILIGGIPLRLEDFLKKDKKFKSDISISLENVSYVINGKKIIDDISLTLYPHEFVGLIGPSGSGKTTLMLLMNGMNMPTAGRILLNNQNLHDYFEAFKGQIGYVPQDDIIHRELTVKESLIYTSKLRLQTTFTDEVEAQVNKVLKTLALTDAQDVFIGTAEKKGISGGQRKRVNLAQELITEPSILFLDEPTSGLDPKSDYDVMILLRNIAEKGKIVLLTTHAITEENFRILTHLIVLTKNGKLAYFGPANQACDYFGVNKPVEIFDKLEKQSPENWKNKYRESHYYKEYVINRRIESQRTESQSKSNNQKRNFKFSQLLVLISRYFKIKTRDKVSTLILLLQAPIIAFFISLVFNTNDEKVQALFIMVIAAIWLGCSNAVREIVSEQAIYKRERMVNLSIFYYLLSKIIVLSLLCVIQCLILVFVVSNSLNFTGNTTALFFILLMTSIASLSIGLLISSLVKTNEAAMGLVPIVLIPKIILGGLISKFAIMKDFIKVMAAFMLSRWAFEASLISEFKSSAPFVINEIGFSPNKLMTDIIIIFAFNLFFFGLTYFSLKRKDNFGK